MTSGSRGAVITLALSSPTDLLSLRGRSYNLAAEYCALLLLAISAFIATQPIGRMRVVAYFDDDGRRVVAFAWHEE